MFSNKLKRMVGLLVVLLMIIMVGITGIFLGYNYVTSQGNRFDSLQKALQDKTLVINKDTPNSVMIVVGAGDDTSDIAQKLKVSGLINNTLIFTLMSKFNGFDGGYLAGTHFLKADLSYDEMMYMLCQEPEVITITFPEGMTYTEVKLKLLDAGLEFDTAKLDECMNSPNLFVDYKFVSLIQAAEGRDFILSGYLFPDTYNFDMNASEEEIVNTFLRNTEAVLYEDFYVRAAKIGMTMDQVMTLASVIQAESGNASDMLSISCVFHNRLKSEDIVMQKLESCATINYLRQIDGLAKVWSADSPADQLRESKYNTYLYAGLIPGPICMPGKDAITAALYPSNENYMYFCATGDGFGGSAFAVTAEEQAANVEKYRPFWTDNPSAAAAPTPTVDPDAAG